MSLLNSIFNIIVDYLYAALNMFQFRNVLPKFEKVFNVKIKYSFNVFKAHKMRANGYFDLESNEIIIFLTPALCNAEYLVSILCHELGHRIQYTHKNIFKEIQTNEQFYKKFPTLNDIVLHVVEHELEADKIGVGICSVYFPGIEYRTSYSNSDYESIKNGINKRWEFAYNEAV